jgi:hypothetical protein
MGRTTALKNFMVKPATLTEARTLTDSDSGKTYFLNAAGGFTITLPEPRGGVNFEFIVKTAPTTDYVITTKDGDAIIIGHVITSDLNASDANVEVSGTTYVRFKANNAKVADSVKMVSDGTYWYMDGFCSLVGGIFVAEQSKSPSTSASVSLSRSPSVSKSASPSISPSISPSPST